jgi:glycogen synthase
MPLSSSNAVRQLSDGNSQGTRLGRSASDLISFYGATPIARLAGGLALTTITASSVLATATSPSTGGGATFTTAAGGLGFIFSSQAQANAIVTGINATISDVTAMWNIAAQIRGHLMSTGIFTGS